MRKLLSMNSETATLRPTFPVIAILPGPEPQPCPEVLTEQEAVAYLRLNLVNTQDPAGALRYYRQRGLLKGTQIGKSVRYRRVELEKFLDRITESNPR